MFIRHHRWCANWFYWQHRLISIFIRDLLILFYWPGKVTTNGSSMCGMLSEPRAKAFREFTDKQQMQWDLRDDFSMLAAKYALHQDQSDYSSAAHSYQEIFLAARKVIPQTFARCLGYVREAVQHLCSVQCPNSAFVASEPPRLSRKPTGVTRSSVDLPRHAVALSLNQTCFTAPPPLGKALKKILQSEFPGSSITSIPAFS